VAVLDIDPKNGGDSALLALETEHGMLDQRSMQGTGSGGFHYLFAPDGATVARGFRPGLDLLTGAGCYIVVSPSVHASGTAYTWLEGPDPLSVPRDTIELLTAPSWLLATALGKAPNRERKKRFQMPELIEDGARNSTLTQLAGTMRRTGMSQDAIVAALKQTNREKCNPPMPDADVEVIAKSVSRYAPGATNSADAGLTPELAKAIKADAHFARDAGGLLYRFEGGVFKPTGVRFIERRTKELCEVLGKTKSWNPELATRIAAWISCDAPELLERPPLDTINVLNGLLDVNTRELRAHSPEHLSPVQLPVTFDASAQCPNIDKFVADVFPSDSQHLAWELAAWLMTPDTSIQKSALLIGEGANGKSVFLSLLLAFLGRDNVSALSLHRIEADKFCAARLVGKLCNIGSDLPTAALTGTSVFKGIVGGDMLTAERKFAMSFEFLPFARLVFSANSPPRSEDSSAGFFRRWIVIPFSRLFDESDPNTVPRAELDARLSQAGELSGLLNRALDKLHVIRAGRFTESDSTRAALAEFRATTDPLGIWLDQNTVERADGMVVKDRLRSAYSLVCQDSGRPILGDVQFTAALKRLRPRVQAAQRRVDGRNTRVFTGIGFVTHDPVPGGDGLF
jgi:putative DNA primase/helicase